MATIVPPDERICKECERVDRWDDEREGWVIDEAGDAYCLHEWDINGTYNPVA
jgi:hypothetical protein